MTATPIRLSICIATYNRASYIGQTLDSIIPQLTDETELVVVDGASTDDTPSVMARYATCERLRYIRLPEKGGVDKDYDLSVQHARGEYCWLFSDDDLIKPGGVQAVLDALAQNHPLIIVNAEARSADLQEMQKPRVCLVPANKTYGTAQLESIFADLAQYLTFIGCVVIQRTVWLAREREKYYGSAFIHVGVIFQAPLPGSCLFIAEPFIVIRYGNASWNARSFQIWMKQWPGLVWSFADISDAAKRRITRKEPWRSATVMFLSRAVGGYSLDIYRKSYAPLMNTGRDRAKGVAIALLPAPLVNTAAVLAFKFARPHDTLMQVNFRNSSAHISHWFGRK